MKKLIGPVGSRQELTVTIRQVWKPPDSSRTWCRGRTADEAPVGFWTRSQRAQNGVQVEALWEVERLRDDYTQLKLVGKGKWRGVNHSNMWQTLQPPTGRHKIGRRRLVLIVSEHYNPYYRTAMMLPFFQGTLPDKLFWRPSQTCQFYQDRPQPDDRFIGTWTLYQDPDGKTWLQQPKDVKRGKLEILSTIGEQDSDSWYFTATDGTQEWLGYTQDLVLSPLLI